MLGFKLEAGWAEQTEGWPPTGSRPPPGTPLRHHSGQAQRLSLSERQEWLPRPHTLQNAFAFFPLTENLVNLIKECPQSTQSYHRKI